ncbi:peptidase S8/S53 domain-containing protein [Triangularia setosa]|uniref:Peptidase S8/S53 domain-containing protein n=1 Tax=Triangularia setosa TaxID=2587417 RepID=A0AAN6W0N8_9PEZI|nr:peptidase S8/S53 domain-containing protein [Podospora setosa]
MSYSTAWQRFHQLQDEAEKLFRCRLFDEGMEQWESACAIISHHLDDNESLYRLRKAFSTSLQSHGLEKAATMTDPGLQLELTESEEGNNNFMWESVSSAIRPTSLHEKQTDMEKQRSTSAYVEGWKSLRVANPFTRKKLGPSNRAASIPVQPTLTDNASRSVRRSDTLFIPPQHMSLQPLLSQETKEGTSNQSIARPSIAPFIPKGQRHHDRPKYVVEKGITGQIPRSEADNDMGKNRPPILMNHSATTNAAWFKNLVDRTHGFVYGPNYERWPKPASAHLNPANSRLGLKPFTPVKIAILDSGISFDGKMASYRERVYKRMDFTQPPAPVSPPQPGRPLLPQRLIDECKDENGHGTAVVYQATITCPSAQIYVGKVVARREGDSFSDHVSRASVARAIIHASQPVEEGGWGVDIINMSFGWVDADMASPATKDATDETISGAISYAASKRVLLFASATNSGLNESIDIFFPARDLHVISVDAEDGSGRPAHFASRLVSGSVSDRFCAPGLGVCNPLDPGKLLDGSSFACPVAAGIAGLVLEFAKQEPLHNCKSVWDALKTPKGMKRVFGDMSEQPADFANFKLLRPWKCFDARRVEGRDEQRERAEVVGGIIKALQREYGGNFVANEINLVVKWEAKLPLQAAS